MGMEILGTTFRKATAATWYENRFAGFETERDRGQAELSRQKLVGAMNLSPAESRIFNRLWNNIEARFSSEGFRESILPNEKRSALCTDFNMQKLGYNPGECLDEIGKYNVKREHAIMKAIDGAFDNYIEYKNDSAPEDTDQTPGRTLTRASGDCEDFAIIKYKAARRAGIPAERLAIAALDHDPTHEGGGHGVLMYKDPRDKWFVLNNDGKGSLVAAEDYLADRNKPYRLYNEDGAYYNPNFDMSYSEYLKPSSNIGM